MPGQNLTRQEAAARADLLAVDAYDVALDLSRAADDAQETFRSTTTVRFRAAAGATTFIDLIAPRVRSIVLNGRELDPAEAHIDSRIVLGGLAPDNELTVVADCAYMRTGEGLHRFTDPADGETYLYSQFEVPDARRVFAVFEQPDLKAPFAFTVTVPEGWTVLSNSPTPAPARRDGAATFVFAPTEPISSYITAVVAGPYRGATGEYRADDGRVVPLGVYCRASLEQYLDAEEILEMTRRGFAYYENLFGTPYAFAKYDQVFVPEFNAGAMENAGCVTHRDDYVFRSRPIEARVERRAVTVLHELAHMWFGDLVTMKWWNDLWLNESFAEYTSTLATAETTRFTDAWTTFQTIEKGWAYNQDQLGSTHPVSAEINDLHDVEVNFDGITYAKGASVLAALVGYVGRENFFAGIKSYLAAHAYANATLDDLLSELAAASGRDLASWSKVWLEEAGVTLLRPVIMTAEDGTTVTQARPYVGMTPAVGTVRVGAGEIAGQVAGAVAQTLRAIVTMPTGLYHAVRAGIGVEERSTDGLISLVGVGRIAGEVSSTGAGTGRIPFSVRLYSMLSLLGSLNLALFAFNLIPLLPLDGGHVAGACWEGLRRRWARATGRPDPGYVDTARMLPVGQAVFVLLVVMTLVLVWVDVVAPL